MPTYPGNPAVSAPTMRPTTPPPPSPVPVAMPTSAEPVRTPMAGAEEKVPVAEALKPEHHAEQPSGAPGCGWNEGDCCVGGSGFFVTADYLYVRPRREALDFAVVGPNRIPLLGGDVESVDLQSRSGFRVGGGWSMGGDGVWFGALWTYLHSDGQKVLGSTPGGQLFATAARAGGVDDVSTAAATANLNYSVIDLDVGKKILVGQSLDINLYGGPRLAWIDQNFDVLYNGGSVGAVNYRLSSPVYFRGVGLSAGGEGTWRIYRGLGLYANARASLLSGEFRNLHSETNNNGAMVLVNLREKYEEVIPVLEIGMGVSVEWQDHIFVKFGYELTNWFNLIHSTDLPDGTGIGRVGHRDADLTLEALRLQVGLTF
jgi:hypothetical protein